MIMNTDLIFNLPDHPVIPLERKLWPTFLYPLIPNVLLLRWSESELAIIENMNTSILNLDHYFGSTSIVRFFEGFYSENHIYTQS